MERGEKALKGHEEYIDSHRFPPDTTTCRTIHFKGEWLSIFNKDTSDLRTGVEKVKEYTPYEVPVGYTCYVIDGYVYFAV